MIKSNTAERAADVSAAAGSSAGLNTSFGDGMRTLAVALGATALSAVTVPAQGGLIDSLTNEPSHRALAGAMQVGGTIANQYGGAAVGLRTTRFGVDQNLTSITLSDRFMLTALHGVTRVLDTNSANGILGGCSLEIYTGPNGTTDRRQIRQVLRIITFAGAAANDPSRPDYCVLELASPLENVRPIVITNAVIGANSRTTGYGSIAEIGGTPVRDLVARGGFAPIDTFTSIFNASYYKGLSFAPTINGPFNQKGQNGDSGSPQVIEGSGVWGMSIAISSGTGATGFTYALKLDQPEVYGNIVTYVPSPGAGTLALTSAGILAYRRRREN